MVIHASSKSYSPPEFNVIKDVKSEIALVLVTRKDDFVFNKELLELNDYILVDMCEYNWDWNLNSSGTHFFGVNTYYFPQFLGEEWDKFDNWVSGNKPKIYFKRELLEKDVKETIYPIEYPSYFKTKEIQSANDFENRPISVFHFWGRSSEYRVKTHTDFWLQSSKNGAAICDNIYYIEDFINNEFNNNKWVSVCIPHYKRIDISQILFINGLSKLSLSMKGCGYKCFRTSESPINSIMVMEDAGLKFTYDWVHGVNCIMYKNDPLPEIEKALEREDLYNIYLNGIKTCEKYNIDNYVKHLESVIEQNT